MSNPNLRRRNYRGKAGEFRVLSELLVRNIWASPIIVEKGSDIILNDGRLVQVRSRMTSSDGAIRCVLFQRHEEYKYDFLVVWAIQTDIFYIFPTKVLKGKKSIYLNPGKKSPPEFHKYLNAWHLLNQ